MCYSKAPVKPRHSKGEYAMQSVKLAVDVHVRMTVTFGSRIVEVFQGVVAVEHNTWTAVAASFAPQFR